MLFSENDRKTNKNTILVAPLDWGLGHAARCIPIITELQNYPYRIIIAADGAVETMLKQQFPHLEFIPLPGYNIKYSKNKRWFKLMLLIQFPKILSAILKEHRWLNKVTKELAICAIISDNRFGLYHSSIPSVYITHQLFIKSGNPLTDRIATLIHRKYIKNYTQCWIPDYESKINLAGSLSHGTRLPSNAVYMGCLSRFERRKTAENTVELLVILSGPEPQRSIFENILFEQLNTYRGRVLFVRGLPRQENNAALLESGFASNIVIKNYLGAAELNAAMQSAALVICRSGYTSIMDLVKLGCRAVLVPTPGQTEQEYLAAYMCGQQIFYTMPQQGFSLTQAIAQAANFPYRMPALDMERYKTVVRQFAESLQTLTTSPAIKQ
jgi:predicted glycosyltransferase